ncbi:hypothetical protein [Ancylobacter terrae]|uniref:hypothetical protein n=1 Tax=Ancylobacter sp. sgz301288 TaxID=3342077 RepID=UPI0038593476
MSRPRSSRAPALHVDALALGAFLRRRHPSDTAKQVATETGVPSRTVQKWLIEGAAPTFAHAMRLVAAYGPALIVACVSPCPGWAAAAARDERRRAIEAEMARLAGELDKIGGAR